MRILYDHQAFSMFAHGGILRYFVELSEGMKRQPDIQPLVGAVAFPCEYTHRSPTPTQRLLSLALSLPSRSIRKRLNRRRSLRMLKLGCFDLFHPTYYRPYFIPHLNGKPFVLTVFDTAQEVMPEYYGHNGSHSTWKRAAVQTAQGIIAISHFTRESVIRELGVAPERVAVVHLGSSLNRSDAHHPIRFPQPFILYVGQRGTYKNFSIVLRAMKLLSSAIPNLRCICAGGGAFTRDETEQIAELDLIRSVGSIPAVGDRHLASLYAHAAAFVFPSLYEGFGIPVLEALSLGCPAILSDISVFREVADDAAVYFDPRSPESLAEAVRKTLADKRGTEALVERGRLRAERFTWEKTVRETAKVYRQIVDL